MKSSGSKLRTRTKPRSVGGRCTCVPCLFHVAARSANRPEKRPIGRETHMGSGRLYYDAHGKLRTRRAKAPGQPWEATAAWTQLPATWAATA